MEFAIRESETEFIAVDVLGYEREPVGEYYDDNWLRIKIQVAGSGFRGSASAAILTEDLAQFTSQLHPLYEKIGGTAKFSTMEGQLELNLTCDKVGRVALTGFVKERPGFGFRLDFAFQLDQSHLKTTLAQLDAVTENFPIRQPNQSTDPTPASGTSPAGQEPRHR
jgi:hypothetical protein